MRISVVSFIAMVAMAMAAAHAAERGGGVIREEWKDVERQRTIPVRIDYPVQGGGPWPVVVISHGLGGSREGLAYIGEYWAQHGYVAVHLQHPGSDESIWKGARMSEAMAAMKAAAGGKQFFARCADVKFALDELTKRNKDEQWVLHGKLDLERIAMAGHSFGAVTTQAVCGEWYGGRQAFYDARIKVGIVFSPSPPAGENAKTAFEPIGMPIFYWTGTKDNAPSGISNVTAEMRRVPFDSSDKKDQYLVVIKDGDHAVFNGRPGDSSGKVTPGRPMDGKWHPLIEKGTTAFLDKYLKKDGEQGKYLDGGEFEKEVKELGTFEKR